MSLESARGVTTGYDRELERQDLRAPRPAWSRVEGHRILCSVHLPLGTGSTAEDSPELHMPGDHRRSPRHGPEGEYRTVFGSLVLN